jgi:hypothetical protein
MLFKPQETARIFFFCGAAARCGTWPPQFLRWDSSGRVISSSQRTLTTHSTHKKQISIPPEGFEPTVSAGARPQTHALDRSASGTGRLLGYCLIVGHIGFLLTVFDTLMFDDLLTTGNAEIVAK